MIAWLRGLPKPCDIFTSTDGWAGPVARYAQEAGLRVPEDLALVAAGNDTLECELISPPLSSVIIPWQEVGRTPAALVRLALANRPIAGRRSLVSPVGVAARRSSDALAVQDPLVAEAVRWIRAQAGRRITVPMVARRSGAVANGWSDAFDARSIAQSKRKSVALTSNWPTAHRPARQPGRDRAAVRIYQPFPERRVPTRAGHEPGQLPAALAEGSEHGGLRPTPLASARPYAGATFARSRAPTTWGPRARRAARPAKSLVTGMSLNSTARCSWICWFIASMCQSTMSELLNLLS